jgi:hypothetical protein
MKKRSKVCSLEVKRNNLYFTNHKLNKSFKVSKSFIKTLKDCKTYNEFKSCFKSNEVFSKCFRDNKKITSRVNRDTKNKSKASFIDYVMFSSAYEKTGICKRNYEPTRNVFARFLSVPEYNSSYAQRQNIINEKNKSKKLRKKSKKKDKSKSKRRKVKA